MNRAKFIAKAPMRSDGRLYEVDPPMEWSGSCHGGTTRYVVVSAVTTFHTGPETYIFPADKLGNITNWSEMLGSFRGALDHQQALENAGYQVVEEL